MKFGDLVCYKDSDPGAVHNGPLLYLGKCRHRGYIRSDFAPDLIDIMDVSAENAGQIEHKSPYFWQVCTHLESAPETSAHLEELSETIRENLERIYKAYAADNPTVGLDDS